METEKYPLTFTGDMATFAYMRGTPFINSASMGRGRNHSAKVSGRVTIEEINIGCKNKSPIQFVRVRENRGKT